MLFQDIAFWVIASVAVVASVLVIHLQNVFRSALLLVVAFLATAGIFVLLNAEFLAAVQILIYGGAISILIIFAITLTQDVQRGNRPNRFQPFTLAVSGLLLASLILAITRTSWQTIGAAKVPKETIESMAEVLTNTPQHLASLMLKEFVLPFEAASVLLLAAILGALVLVRER